MARQDDYPQAPVPQLAAPGIYLKDDSIESVELVLPFDYMQRIRNYLFEDRSREYICHLLCGHTLVGKRLRLLGCQIVYPLPDHYACQSIASLRMTTQYDHALRDECDRQKLSLIDIHSHPFASHHVGFSAIDDNDEVEKHRYFERNLPDSLFGSIVMGTHALEARIFLSGPRKRPRVLPLRIFCRDIPLSGSEENHKERESTQFDRQVLAFGPEGQKNLSQLKVGVVGVGGLGASIALGLARLGVMNIVLIDHDHAEPSNLNRLAGMTSVDAILKPQKVDLVARRIAEICPQITLDLCACDVFEPGAWQRLRDADLLVASTDNFAPRMLLNALAHQYLIPLISVGTVIQTNEGKLCDGFGEIYSIMPGQPYPCLLCSQVINKAEAYYELAPDELRREAASRGYIQGYDVPAPSVYHLNGIVANLALLEIHNLACGFMERKPHLYYTMSERSVLEIEHEPDCCSVCSPAGWNFARGDQIDVADLFHIPAREPLPTGADEKEE